VIAILYSDSNNINENILVTVKSHCNVSAFSEIPYLMNCFRAPAQVQYKECIIFPYLVDCDLATDPSLMQEDFGHPELLPVFSTIMV
jgi:hypothetical protein